MSATTQPRLVQCPACGESVAWTNDAKFRPFCSERCKLIDLGEWVMEERAISGESVHFEQQNLSEQFWQ